MDSLFCRRIFSVKQTIRQIVCALSYQVDIDFFQKKSVHVHKTESVRLFKGAVFQIHDFAL